MFFDGWDAVENQYQQLPLLERQLLQVLAAGGDESFTKTSLLQCFSRLRLDDAQKRSWKVKQVRQGFDNLLKKNLVTTRNARLSTQGPLRMVGLLDLLDTGRFSALAGDIQQKLSPEKPFNVRYYHDLTRAIQLLILTGQDRATLGDFLFSVEYQYSFFDSKPPLETLFFSPYHPGIIPHILRNNDASIGGLILGMVAQYLLPLFEIGDLALLVRRSLGHQQEELEELVAQLLFCGRNDLATQLLQDPAIAEAIGILQIKTLLAVFSGKTAQALQGFDDWLKIRRKRSRRKLVLLPGIIHFLYLLTLLRSNDPQHLNQGLDAVESLTRAIKRKRQHTVNRDQFLCLSLYRPFANLLARQVNAEDEPVNVQPYTQDCSLDNLFICMILAWIKPKNAKKYAPLLRKIIQQATGSQNLWVVAESANILAHLGIAKNKYLIIVREIRGATGLTCLSDSFVRLPAWEKKLRALQALAATTTGSSSQTGATRERLVWILDPDPDIDQVRLTPKIQKQTRNGRWSKGRPVALKTLMEEASRLEALSAQDRALAAKISAHRQQTYGYYRGRIVYSLDPAKALPLLVGHPLVFLHDAPTTRVDIVANKPVLRITRAKTKVRLELFPAPKDVGGTVALIRETPTRYNLIELNEQQHILYQILNRTMTIPRQAVDSLLASIPSLSSLVTVQSDLEGAVPEADRKPGDPRPHIHLLPLNKGLQVECFVRPLAVSDTWCKPGRGGETIMAQVDNKPMMAIRNLEEEKKQWQQVLDSCPSLARTEPFDERYLFEDPEECLELLLELGQLGDRVVLEWPKGERFRVRGEASFDNLSLQLKKQRDWFAASGTLQVDQDLTLDLKQLLMLLERSPGRFVQLDDGSFLALTRTFRKRISELRSYGDYRGKGVRIPPLASLALEDLTEKVGKVRADKHWKTHVARLRKPVHPTLPTTLKARLRPYQEEGFAWLARLSHWGVGGCLADDMGLGKTVQALAVALLRASDGPSLVVAPVSVLANWQDEARRFAPTLQVHLFGPGDRDKTLAELGPFSLVLCSYGLLPTEIERLAKVKWQMVVLDEAQAIKNVHTKRSQAAMRLQAEFRLATTGTPLENNLLELWTLFRFLNPGLLGSRKSFHERFVVPIEMHQDRESRQRLRRLIRPFLLRRLKSEVLQELPQRTDITLKVVMSPEEAALYEAHRQRAVEKLAESAEEEKGGSRHLRILAEIMRLRRLCCNPRLVDDKSAIASSKLRVFGDILADLLAGNHKALVFSQFVDHLHIIRHYLENKGISYKYLDGQTSRQQRQARIQAFQGGEGDVFLISLKAGGTGLNLTAADYVIHMDPWWNPAVEDQASDRAHRIGQERPVTVYRLVTQGTIEEQIVHLHEEKRDLADSLLAGGDISAQLSGEELLHLLQQEQQ